MKMLSLAVALATALFGAAAGLLPHDAAAAPKADLWPRWQANDPNATTTIDHAAWAKFLSTYLVSGQDGINRVAYANVTPDDRKAVASYVDRLVALPISKYNRNEQRAYWMNLYNALTIRTVLEHYPVKSIRDISISPGLFSSGPWGKKLVKIEGEEVSLDDIEHRILRPIWRDPRTHYTVNCASIGCPNLARKPYTPADMEAMLDEGARAYVNNPRGFRVENGKLRTSSIYEWFKDDFGGNDAGVIAHAKKYANADLAAKLGTVSSINGNDYDWALNDAGKGR
jgi:hypothetical protein